MPPRVIIGTAGHIDHGKSALVLALTGTDPDRLKEEKARGITIELGFAHLRLPSGTLAGIIDVPGHERFVRTMVAGAAGIDIVVLVIAADEGIKPQTREHLDICRLLSIRHGVVVLNKRDRVDAEWVALQEEEVRTFVCGTFLDNAPVLHVSAVTGQGLPELVTVLDSIASRMPGKDPSLPFRLPVDRAFTMKGFGTVVTGTVVAGEIRSGEEVAFLPGGSSARIRGIQVHGEPSESAAAGNRAAINLQGIDREDVRRGSVLCRPGTFVATRAVEAEVEYLSLAKKPMKQRERVTFHAGTASATARVVLYGATGIPPGGSGLARIEFDEPFVLSGGDRFILRGFSPLENFGYTVGGGVIRHPHPPRRRTIREAPPALERLRSHDPAVRIEAALDDAGIAGTDILELARIAAANPEILRGTVDRLVSSGVGHREKLANGYRLWHRSTLIDLARRCGNALAELHRRSPERNGFQREELAASLGGNLPIELVSAALRLASGIESVDDRIFLPELLPRAVELASPLAVSIERFVRDAGLSGPTLSEIRDTVRLSDIRTFEKTMEGMVRAGSIVRIKELLFDPDVIAELRERLIVYLEERGEITVSEFKELTGLSRKYMIPLIEHFDQTRLTLRVGDRRTLRKQR